MEIHSVIDFHSPLYPYPNPFSLSFRISEACDYKISDLLGRFCIIGKTDSKNSLIEMSGFPGGLYFLSVFKDGTWNQYKLIKTNLINQ
jgi:hypothetical protein